MGLFSKPVVSCGVCGREIGSKEKRWSTKDGFLCPDCQKPFGILGGSRAFVDYTCEQIVDMKAKRELLNEALEKNREVYNSFQVTRTIEPNLCIDDEKQKWYIIPDKMGVIDMNGNTPVPMVFDFSEILEVYTSLGEKTIISSSSSRKEKGIRKAVAGQLIAGSTGAILGGMMAKTKTTTQATETQNVFVNIIIEGLEEPLSYCYKTEQIAEQIRRILASMITDSIEETEAQTQESFSSADEILKFKQLLDSGIITEDEFNTKKKQLLGL